jgi:hypothetical protein
MDSKHKLNAKKLMVYGSNGGACPKYDARGPQIAHFRGRLRLKNHDRDSHKRHTLGIDEVTELSTANTLFDVV